MRILCDLYPFEITELATQRLERLRAERTEKIKELQSLIGVFRQRIAAKEEHSDLFRENLASIQCSIEDLEDSCSIWQREIDLIEEELIRRKEGEEPES